MQLNRLNESLQQALIASDRCFEVLDTEPDIACSGLTLTRRGGSAPDGLLGRGGYKCRSLSAKRPVYRRQGKVGNII
jgi:hypothetical protein